MLDQNKREKIAWQVIKTLISRFETFPEDSSNNRNAPFHEAFLNAFSDKLKNKVQDIPFFLSLSSWLHGLSTTLGQSFFENISHILSDGEKKAFSRRDGFTMEVTAGQKMVIANIITDLKNSNQRPCVHKENELLQSAAQDSRNIEANNFTADVFYETDNNVIAIELKTVKPNAGEMRGEKQKILEAKSTLLSLYPNKEISFYLGFPFDPKSSTATGSDKELFLFSIIDGIKYFDPDEVLLAGELWDFLSGDNDTMQQILNIINTIATPAFMETFAFLNNSKNRLFSLKKYMTLLNKWFLYSEIELVDKYLLKHDSLQGRANTIYWQSIFSKGEYKLNRYLELKRLCASW